MIGKTYIALIMLCALACQAEELVPIPLVLPKPTFYTGPAPPKPKIVEPLRKPSGKRRPPFLAPKGTTNVALGKEVISSDMDPVIGDLEMVTNGSKSGEDRHYVELGPFSQWVQVDLGAPHRVHAIVFWHYHRQARIYKDVTVGLADDAAFTRNVRVLFNNDHDNSSKRGRGTDPHYYETNEGELVDARGLVARYVRLYSNGNSANEMNHYIEVEVFGQPAK